MGDEESCDNWERGGRASLSTSEVVSGRVEVRGFKLHLIASYCHVLNQQRLVGLARMPLPLQVCACGRLGDRIWVDLVLLPGCGRQLKMCLSDVSKRKSFASM